jgi:hypothetical protein
MRVEVSSIGKTEVFGLKCGCLLYSVECHRRVVMMQHQISDQVSRAPSIICTLYVLATPRSPRRAPNMAQIWRNYSIASNAVPFPVLLMSYCYYSEVIYQTQSVETQTFTQLHHHKSRSCKHLTCIL